MTGTSPRVNRLPSRIRHLPVIAATTAAAAGMAITLTAAPAPAATTARAAAAAPAAAHTTSQATYRAYLRWHHRCHAIRAGRLARGYYNHRHNYHYGYYSYHRHYGYVSAYRTGRRHYGYAAAYHPATRPASSAAASATAGGSYSLAGLEQLWISAGGPASAAPRAARIAECESGGQAGAHNPSGATGVWQILGQVVPGNLSNPAVNAQNAVAKFNASGGTFAQWTCQ